MPRPRQPANPFRYFHSSPELIREVVMLYVRFPLSLADQAGRRVSGFRVSESR
jgi:hypothetical protein